MRVTLVTLGILLTGIGAGWWLHPGLGLFTVGGIILAVVLIVAVGRTRPPQDDSRNGPASQA